MKRALISLCLVLGMTVPFAAPTHSLFGLSKCEKVKKEVNSLEGEYFKVRKDLRGQDYTYTFKGNSFTFFIPTEKSIRNIDSLIANDPLPKIWKLATNNPKCFTNTQNIQVSKMQNSFITDFLNHSMHVKYRNDDLCKKLLSEPGPYSRSENISKCYLGEVPYIFPDYIYKSIYTY